MPDDFRNSTNDWRSAVRARWVAAVDELAQGSPMRVWREPSEIEAALNAMLGEGTVAYLRPGGTRTLASAGPSGELGCLELHVDPRLAYVVCPHELTLLHFETHPAESVVVLRLAGLAPCGVYERDPNDPRPDYDNEEVLETHPGHYVNADLAEAGLLGHTGTGQPIPMTDDARRIVRWFRGTMVIMSGQSLLNKEQNAIAGFITQLSVPDIRALIEGRLRPTAH